MINETNIIVGLLTVAEILICICVALAEHGYYYLAWITGYVAVLVGTFDGWYIAKARVTKFGEAP
ncbi:hypothetical protein HAP48_0042595 [Bradyrhizobium septentrionale]|uniref:Uncharacterized protein n=1 Tax=Bradyrhizobium septentrionale TaxID=1404411 RepID=A0A973W399_9BRAD|nr:hypothetical protein [Bradyrhizobium septentrionale]UGY15149.1 hypothetical protein HAP48_0042595 [Bradyrhizobium septentrionale]